VKKTFCIIVLFQSLISFPQGERSNYAQMASLFVENYNQGDYEAIFENFDTNMKVALPLEKTIEFFEQNVHASSGNIIAMEFYKLKQDAHIYKTTFEKTILDVLISLNGSNEINGLYIQSHKLNTLSKMERNTTKMILPFREEWFVFWGGTTVEQNYHVSEKSQKYAYDLLIVANGTSYEGDPMKNENYFVFGKDIIAPCDAVVAKVITGVHDNIPGEVNPNQLTGNTIVLETENNEYIFFAHLKEDSIVVKKGQMVMQGDKLGECGNSGNTTEPHLHLSLQNTRDMNKATGAKLYFDNILVNDEIKEDYLPVKEDFIKNIN